MENWPAEASILTVPVKKPAGSATTCKGCRKTGSLWYLGTLCLTHSHSHSVVMHPVQPRPPGITHLITVCGLLSLYLAAVFSISQKDTESWCPPWFHALAKFRWTRSSSFVYFSFLLGKTHQFQILPISFSMFPTCSSYPHYLQFKSNIIPLYLYISHCIPIISIYLPWKIPWKIRVNPMESLEKSPWFGCLHLRGACIHRGVRHVKRSQLWAEEIKGVVRLWMVWYIFFNDIFITYDIVILYMLLCVKRILYEGYIWHIWCYILYKMKKWFETNAMDYLISLSVD